MTSKATDQQAPECTLVNDNHSSLAERTINAARQRFLSYGHHPSPEHWRGLSEIAVNIEAQAAGRAEKKFYLSALPTGMGKTTIVIESVKQLVSDPAHVDTGIIIFVNQLKLIPSLAKQMGLEEQQFAVRTGDAELNKLGAGTGNPKSNDPRQSHPHLFVQVLFTTQQKLMALSFYRRNFAKNTFLFYRGKPRTVRIWDEAIIPIDPITLTVSHIDHFASDFDRINKEVAMQIRQWAATLPYVSNGSVTVVPQFNLDMSFVDISELDDMTEHDATAWALMRMCGSEVRVHQDEYFGATIIGYREILPTEFAPLLVLDASGELRAAYKAWDRGRGDLVILLSPTKTYSNLTIHHWDHAAGKGAHRDSGKRNALVNGAVSAFFDVPNDKAPVLFIVRKPERRSQNMERLIRAGIKKRGGDQKRAHFLTWGFHSATNEYKDVKNLVVVGALQTPYPHYIALLRGSGRMAVDTPTLVMDVKAVRKSEIAHEIFSSRRTGCCEKISRWRLPYRMQPVDHVLYDGAPAYS